MSDYHPTQEQQRSLYNHFVRLQCELRGQIFTPIPEGTPAIYDTPQIFAALAELYGRKCQVATCEGRSANLVIDHINGNKSDYDSLNLRIVCKRCNQKEHKFQVQHPSGNTGKLEKENVPATKNAITRSEAEAIAITAPIFKRSKDYKREVRIYLSQKTANGGTVNWRIARADLIAITGMSRNKADEYLTDYTESELQPFQTDGQMPYPDISRRPNVNYAELSIEDRQSYEEAERLVLQEKARLLDEERAKVQEAQQESQASILHLKICEELKTYIGPHELAVKPVDYLLNPKRYQSNGMDGPTCLKCGQRKPMDHGQLVCNSCKAALRLRTIDNGNGHASKAGEAAAAL